MSKVVDERVVSMQFDNKHFESNVQTTMSTLDKLKAKLNFKDSSAGLENLNASARKCSLAPLSNAVDNVGIKFNAMYTIADQALRNITNSAMAAGKRIVSALTIDPIKTGLSEYETQINSVQTILANTSHQGTTIDDVNRSLEELNKYADQTIYNFTEMTRNIGTFTAAGLDLETSTKAIQGIANLAAVSGSTSQQASTAMYQLSQALSAGTVRVMDWNSVVNASMGGKVFQDAIIATAKAYGGVADAAVAAYESGENFKNLLNPKDYGDWFTSDILAETLQKFTKVGAVEYLAKVSSASEESIKELQELGETVGYDSDQFDEMAKSLANGDAAMAKTIKDVLTMANTATDAATKVKTFSQMWDVMKETVQSGWAQTWKIIFGDFEEAKAIFTPLTDFFTGIINRISDARNTFLEAALGSPFGQLGEKISKLTGPITDAGEALGDYSEIVDRVMSGEFGNGQERWDKLTEMGYNWAHAQNLVNEKLGNSFRRVVELTEAQGEHVGTLEGLTDEKLKDLGLTEAEIVAYRELERQAKDTGKPISELIDSLETRSGRDLLIDSVKNFGSALTSIAGAAGKAWKEIFDPIKPESLYKAIDSFEDFTAGVKAFWENTDNLNDLTRVFKGLFAAIDIIGTISGGAIKFVFNVISEVLGLLDVDILGAAANIGDAIVALRDWIDECTGLKDAAKSVAEFIVSAADAVKSWFTDLREAEDIPSFIANGILSGIKAVINAVVELGKTMLARIKGILGIHSPSTEFFEIGKNIIQGLVNGLISGGQLIWNTVKDIGTKALEAIKSIDYNKLISVIVLGGVLVGFMKIANAIKNFSKPFEAAGEVLEEASEVVEGVADTVKNFAKVVKSYSGLLKAKAVKELAIAIGIIVGAVAGLYILAGDTNRLKSAVTAMAILAAVLVAMSFAISLLNKIPSVDFGKTSLVILSVSLAAVLMASAMKKLEGLDADKWKQTVASFAVAVGALGVLITALGLTFGLTKLDIGKVTPLLFKLTAAMTAFVFMCKLLGSMKPQEAQQGAAAIGWLTAIMGALIGFVAMASVTIKAADPGPLANSMIKMSAALLVMSVVMKILSTMDGVELGRGYAVLLGLTLILALLTKITSIVGDKDFSALGNTLLKMSVAMAIMFGLIAFVGNMDPTVFDQGYGALWMVAGLIAALTVVIGLLSAFTKRFGGGDISKLGGTLIQMSVAMGMLALVVKSLAKMDPTEFENGYWSVAGLIALIALLVGITNLVGGKDLKKVGSTVMAMSVSMLLLAGACALLSVFNQNGSVLVAAAALAGIVGMMALVMESSKGMENCKGNIIALTAAIIAISVALAALSFIAASDPKALGIAALSIAGLMAVFGLMTKLMGHATAKIAPLIVMTAAVGILGGILYLLASLPDPEDAVAAAAALSIVMIALAGALALAGVGGGAAGGLALLAASAGIVAISAALWLLAQVPFDELKNGLIALGLALVGIVAAAGLLTLFGAGAAGLVGVLLAFSAVILAVGLGLIAFSGSLYIAGLALPLLGEGFAALGEGLTALITTMASCYEDIGKFVVVVLALSAAIVLVGSALSIAAPGVALFSVALVVLSAAVLIASIGVVAFAGALYVVGLALPLIANGMSVLGPALQTFITDVATCKESMGDFADVMGTLGTSILGFLLKLAGGLAIVGLGAVGFGVGCTFLAAGLALVGASIVVVAAGILALGVGFVGLGVGAGVAALGILGLGLAIALAIDLVVGAVFNIGEQTKQAGVNLVQGFANGITSAINYIKEALGGFVNSCISTICELLGIESPSKVFMQLGEYTGEGFALGIDNSTSKVNESATNLANSAQTSMETAGTEGSTSFMDSLGDGIDLSSIDVGSLNMESIKSSLGGAGTAGGTSFMTGLTDKLGSSSIDVSSLNFSSLTESFGSVGADSGSSFLSGFGDSLSASNMDLGSFDMSSITSMFGQGGSDAAASFAEGVNSSTDSATLEPSLTKMLGEVSDSKSEFKQAGIDLLTAFTTGVTKGSVVATTRITSMASSMVSAVSGKSAAFYSAGASLARGFARGVSDFSYLAINAANAMVNTVVLTVRNGLLINSPSKVFMEIGRSIPEGFAMGIDDLGGAIVKSTTSMADVAISGTRDAIARVAEVINTDIDSQPTIRPVLDLSDVESGAGRINGLFGMQPSVELLTNVGSINTMMNGRQNGLNTTNDDVVAAIKDLKSAISKSSGDSYSINGITYDDGSNIADTIKSLVRVSRIEGRI